MKSVLALVLAPGLALAVQGIMYALVTPECSTQTRLQIHLAAAVALAAVVVLALLALGESSLRRGASASFDSDAADHRKRFVADLATAVAGLSALVILAMWFGSWVLSPCDI